MTVDQLGKAIVAAGLLPADQLKAFWSKLPAAERPKDGKSFAELLIQHELLTRFQAQQLLTSGPTPLLLGDYVVLEKIGAGGMGQVFRAKHRHMDRLVAIKLLPAATTQDEAAVKRFQREVKAAAKLVHPNIVQAYDAGVQRGVWYLVMENIPGRDLSALSNEMGPLPVEAAVDYILQAARGLAYAHAEGVVHRDIKPANLLLDRKGTVKILDMGLARFDASADAADQQITGSGVVMGTVDYMPPEQAQSTHDADARSDIYSLGCTLFRLLNCDSVYQGETAVKKIIAHMNAPIPSLCARRPDVPHEIDRIFQKMVAKAPDHRYQRAQDVVADLESWCNAHNEAATSTARPEEDSKLSEFFRAIEQPTLDKQAGRAIAVEPVAILDPTATALQPTLSRMTAEAVTSPQARGALPAAAMKNVTATRLAQRRQKPPIALVAGIVGGFALMLFLGIWLIVRDKDGNEVARVQVPEGGSVEQIPSNLSSPRVGEGPGVRGSASPRAISKTPADPHRAAAETVLTAGGTISIILSDRDQNISKLADLPAEPFVLFQVRFDAPDKPLSEVVNSLVPIQRSLDSFQVIKPKNASHFTDEHMALLSEMDCQVLKLNSTAVTDVSVARLASSHRVTDVALTNLGDACSAAIENWPYLNSLQFAYANLTAAGFEALQRLPELTWLSYESSGGLTGECLAKLEKLPKLTSLSLYASPLDAGCLAALAKLKQLRHLRIQNCGVSDENAVRLQQALPQAFIEHPALSATSEEKECIEWILQHGGEVAGWNAASIKSAESLPSVPFSVKFTKDVPDGIEASRLTSLRFVRTLYWLRLESADMAVEHLCKLSSLDVLAITDSDLTSAGLRRISSLQNLNQLSLSRNGHLDDAALAELPSLSSLHVLDLNACPLYGPGLAHLMRTPTVQRLNLRDTAVSSESLKHLIPLKNLRHLLLAATPIDDTAIEHLSQCTSLQRVELNGTRVTRAGIERLHKALPHCTIQWDGPLVRPEVLAVAVPDSPAVTDWGLNKAPDPAVALHRRAAEAVLAAGGTVTVETAESSKTVSKPSDLPDEPFAVSRVDVFNSESPLSRMIDAIAPIQHSLHALVITRTDGGVTHLSKQDLEKLRELNCRVVGLSKTDVTDDAASSLAGWQGIQEMQLSNTEAGDEICRVLSRWPLLANLNLGRSAVTDEGLKALEACPALYSLSLDDCHSITPKGLAPLARMPHLRALRLKNIELGDEAIEPLAAASQLRYINLQSTGVSDEGARRLQTRLPKAYIDHPATAQSLVNDEIVRWALAHKGRVRLTELSNAKAGEPVTTPVESIVFADGSPPASEAERLAQAYCLRNLAWPGLTPGADEALAHLANLASLKSLELARSDLSGEGLARLSPLEPLQSLILSSGQRIDDNALGRLPDLPCLTFLGLASCPVSGPGLEHLQRAPHLQSLGLQNTLLQAEGLRHLEPLKHLRELYLYNTPIDDAAVAHLSQCTALRRLDLRRTKFTRRGIDQLHQALPYCIIQWDRGLVLPAVAAPSQAGAANASSGPKANVAAKSTDPHRVAAEAVLRAGGQVGVATSEGHATVRKLEDLPWGPIAVYDVRISDTSGSLSEVIRALAPIQRSIQVFQILRPASGVADAARLNDTDFAPLVDLDCRVLALIDTSITNASLERLTANTRITQLSLTRADDAMCRTIAQWPRLTMLNLRESPVTEKGLAELQPCRQLSFLKLDACSSLTADGLAAISRLPSLRMLDLTGTPLNGKCVDALAKLTQLRWIGLQHCGLSDDDARRLQQALPQTCIDHPATELTAAEKEVVRWVIAQHGAVENMTSVDAAITFAESGPSASEATRLAAVRHLRKLIWNQLSQADDALVHLAKIPSLEFVELIHSDLTGAGLARLASLGGLKELRLSYNTGLDDAAWARLPPLPALRSLRLEHCQFTGDGLQHLRQAPNLQALYLQGTPISSTSLQHLAPLEQLRYLNLYMTPIDDAAVDHLSQLTGLQQLNVLNTQVTRADIDRLHKALPHCTIQWDGPLVRPVPLTRPGDTAGQAPGKDSSGAKARLVGPTPPRAIAPFDAKQARAHQEAWAKHLGVEVETTNSVGAKMVLIPPGEFLMGSSDEQMAAAQNTAGQAVAELETKLAAAPEAERAAIVEDIKTVRRTRQRIETTERPQHRVIITRPFLMAASETTVGQFKKFSESGYLTEAERAEAAAKSPPPQRPSGAPSGPVKVHTYRNRGFGDELPAACLTWNDAVAFCRWLSERENATYRLPTEAEWEYACRAGTTTQYSFGDDAARLDIHAWYGRNAGENVHPAGLKPPNGFGLQLMHGNLLEWCHDFYEAGWYAVSPVEDPTGPDRGMRRVIRGGYWRDLAPNCRSAYRGHSAQGNHSTLYGCRIVRLIDGIPTSAPLRTTPSRKSAPGVTPKSSGKTPS